jgi:uncharacterized protein
MKFSQFNFLIKTEDQNVVICNTLTGAIFVLSENKYLSIREEIKVNQQSNDKASIIKELNNAGILLDDSTNEFQRMCYLSNNSRYRNSFLDLRILPTEECNCRCIYCYESFKRGEMTEEVKESVKLMLMKRIPYIKDLSIGWFGGEPMMAMNTIADISNLILELMKKYDFKYNTQITTNGFFLNRDNFLKLLDLKINNIQITLDGDKEEHDKRKRLIDGSGTFDVIMDNLNNISKIDKDYQLTFRINLDHNNINSIPRLINKLKNIFCKKNSYSIFYRSVGNWGGNNNIDNSQLFSSEENRSIQSIIGECISNETNYVFDIPLLMNRSCYASNPQCFTIGSNGTIYKCTVYFESEKNKIGILDKNGDLKIDINKASEWIECRSSDKRCTKCYLYPSCHGKHCPAQYVIFKKTKCPNAKYTLKNNLMKYYNASKIQHM